MISRLAAPCLFLLTAASLVRGAAPKAEPVDPAKWKAVPCVKGRLATDADVKAGRAVFVISGGAGAVQVHPLDMPLPRCAVWRDTERNEIVPVVCIQAEEKNGNKIVGFRIVRGGLGMATVSELIFLEAPDARFKL